MNSTAEIRRANLHKLLRGAKEKGYNQKSFAARAKMSESYLTQLKGGTRDMGETVARGIEDVLSLGKGWMDKDRETDSAVNEPESEYGDGMAAFGLVTYRIPLISWVQAGNWDEAFDSFEPGDADDWLVFSEKHSKRAYALTVKGDSMARDYRPAYFENDVIIVDPDCAANVTTGDRVIAKLLDDSIPESQQVTFKSIVFDGSSSFLKPLNNAYPILTDDFQVIGKVIGVTSI